jgi:VIT1/CCC1 family predicted Fe2+/Mn2+ transporter
MDPDADGRAVLLVAPTLLLATGFGATLAAGVPPRVVAPGAVGMVVTAAVGYYYAGQVISLRSDTGDDS